jgi:hypothetical protein
LGICGWCIRINSNLNIFYNKLIVVIFISFLVFISTINIQETVKSENNSNKYFINIPTPKFTDIMIKNTTYTMVQISNCISNEKIGDPQIPIYPVSFVIPYSKSISNIKITSNEQIDLSSEIENKTLFPNQKQIPLNLIDNTSIFYCNESMYQSNSFIPSNIFKLGEISYCRGIPIQIIYLYPIQYIPLQNKLLFHSSFTVNIEFNHLNNKNKYLRGLKEDKDFIYSLISNPEDLDSYSMTNISSNPSSLLSEDRNNVESSLSDNYPGGL